MIYRIPANSVLVLFILSFAWTTSLYSASQGTPIQNALDAVGGGEIAGGVELRLVPAVGAERKAATDYLLHLVLQIRNGGQVPIIIDSNMIGYPVEYEIDSIWYRMEGIPANDALVLSVAPGGQSLISLIFVTNDSYRYHGLYAVDSNGTGGRLNLKAGKHSIRVRTIRSALQSSALQGKSLVSNTIAVDIPAVAIPAVASSQSARTPDITRFRFAAGPADGLDVVNNFLKQPSSRLYILFSVSPKLADFDALRVLPPIAFNDMGFPETPQPIGGGAPQYPTPSFPPRTTLFAYLVEAGGLGIASISMRVNASGHAVISTPNPDTNEIVRALGQLAAMDRIRTGSYEPRLLRVGGRSGSIPAMVLWLSSESGNSDLFYELPNQDPRVSGQLRPETLYSKEEFLKLASTYSAPTKDAGWAIRTVLICAANAKSVGGSPLLFDKATAVPMQGRTGALQWRVTIPEQSSRTSPQGAEFIVDESTGTCSESFGRE